jgi:hypothetical protein
MPSRSYENYWPSVTEVLGLLRKPGLEQWFKNNTKEHCDKESQEAKDAGTSLHESIEYVIKNGCTQEAIAHEQMIYESNQLESPEGLISFRSFQRYLIDYPHYTYDECEIQLTSELYSYNGTIDCLGKSGNTIPVIFDWKTGKAGKNQGPHIYDEYCIQAAAYAHLLEEMKGIKVEEAAIVSFAKDKLGYTVRTLNKRELFFLFDGLFLQVLAFYFAKHVFDHEVSTKYVPVWYKNYYLQNYVKGHPISDIDEKVPPIEIRRKEWPK